MAIKLDGFARQEITKLLGDSIGNNDWYVKVTLDGIIKGNPARAVLSHCICNADGEEIITFAPSTIVLKRGESFLIGSAQLTIEQ